jgi:aldose 1-epimerase
MEKNHFLQIETTKTVKSFGLSSNGEEVLCYTLSNKNGCEFSVINYGATITSLKIPISNTKKVDVVLGFDTLENYINSFYLPSPPYFGTTVGRYAGRINNAAFSLNGQRHFLNKNHGEHNIHGGILGFSRKLWKVMIVTLEENPSITLEYISKSHEENFPGELTVKVTYTLTEENQLKVNYTANSDEDTILNLTQHSYFNLDGHSNDVTNQELQINSNKVLATNEELIPTGEFAHLKNHDFDFSSVKSCPTAIDNTFVLETENAAVLFSKKNRLKMTVETNQPAVHVYVGGNCFNQLKGKENTNYHAKSGICFETQNFPDAPNHSHFPTAVLKKGDEYNHHTTFKFENI